MKSKVIWTWQNWRWGRHEVSVGYVIRKLDAVITCYGWLWRIEIVNRSLAVEVLLAGLGIK